MENRVIRPEPTVFADYQDEKFEQTVQTDNVSPQLRKMIQTGPGRLVYLTERVDYPEEGILMKYKDIPYLRQGFVFPEALDAVNNLKRVSVLFLAVLKGKGIKGKIGSFLAHYCWIAEWMFLWYDPNSGKHRQIYLKENRYRRSVRELIKLINNFIANLGIKVYTPETHYKDFGRVVGTMIEYDNAYHWRMEDIFAETSKELLLKNPKKEFKRLLKIYKKREKSNIEFKAESIVKALNLLFYIPGVKRAFKKAVESIDIERMKPRKDDLYFMMNFEGYDFQGKTLEERQKIWLDMTDGVPPLRIRIN